jgi:hypothetical protein
MQIPLLAMLMLTSSGQVRGDARPLPEPRRDRQVVGVRVMLGGNPQVRRITIAMPAPPVAEDEDDEQPLARPVMRVNIQTAVLERENFDNWLFADESTEEARSRHLDDILRARVEAAAREYRLTRPQRAKLRLAGKGDIKRFFDQVEERRNAFETERQSWKTGLAALRRLDPLVQIYHEGPFGDDSLFAKTLHRINDDAKSGH